MACDVDDHRRKPFRNDATRNMRNDATIISVTRLASLALLFNILLLVRLAASSSVNRPLFAEYDTICCLGVSYNAGVKHSLALLNNDNSAATMTWRTVSRCNNSNNSRSWDDRPQRLPHTTPCLPSVYGEPSTPAYQPVRRARATVCGRKRA